MALENSPGDWSLYKISHCVLKFKPSCCLQGVPSSNVGGDTTNLARGASRLVHLCEALSTGLEVVVPAQPASVAGINVHDDVGKVEGLERVRNTLLVASCGVLASLLIDVGDQVGERVRLDDEGKGLVGVLLEDASNDIDVLGLVPADLANREFTVGSLSSAVTAWEIVDDETQDVLARDVGCELGLQLLDVRNGVEPEEGADISDLCRGSCEALVAEVLDSGLNLGLVEGVGVEGVGLEHVVVATELDGSIAGPLGDGGRESSGKGGQSQDRC